MSKPKLVYFRVKGRGEPIRYILAQGGADYEAQDVQKEEWPALKPSTPLGQLPYFVDEGVTFSQTGAIARYCGEKYGLAPSRLIDKAQCDQYAAHILQDVFDKFVGAYFNTVIMGDKAVGDQKFAEFEKNNLPGFMSIYEKIFTSKHFLVGEKLTWADLVAAEMFKRIMDYKTTALDEYPKVKAFTQRIHELPDIKKHVDSVDYP